MQLILKTLTLVFLLIVAGVAQERADPQRAGSMGWSSEKSITKGEIVSYSATPAIPGRPNKN